MNRPPSRGPADLLCSGPEADAGQRDYLQGSSDDGGDDWNQDRRPARTTPGSLVRRPREFGLSVCMSACRTLTSGQGGAGACSRCCTRELTLRGMCPSLESSNGVADQEP